MGFVMRVCLISALSNPFQLLGREELYPSIQAKAAQLCFGLVKNHSMADGSDTIPALASGEISAEDILKWIIEHQQ